MGKTCDSDVIRTQRVLLQSFIIYAILFTFFGEKELPILFQIILKFHLSR